MIPYPELIAIRKDAEGRAVNLLESKRGHFGRDDLDYFLTLLNTEIVPWKSNRIVLTRFQRSFIGANKVNIIRHLDAFNDWAVQIWTCEESELANRLNIFWQMQPVKGGGTGLPTMILYLRDPLNYNVWLPDLGNGLNRLYPQFINIENRTFYNYQRFNSAVNSEIRRPFALQPQEVDFILYCAVRGL